MDTKRFVDLDSYTTLADIIAAFPGRKPEEVKVRIIYTGWGDNNTSANIRVEVKPDAE